MWNIIIVAVVALFAISLIITLTKYVLFHPRTNSVVSIICLFALLFFVYRPLGITAFEFVFLFLLPVIDCVRDAIIAPEYYENDIEDRLDKLYMIKSLTSLFTLGFARNVFLLVIDPMIACSVRRSLKWEFLAGSELSGIRGRNGQYVKGKLLYGARRYHFLRQVKTMERNGLAVSNKETGKLEIERSKKKLEGLYPQKFIETLAEAVSGNKELKEKRNRAEKQMRREPGVRYLPASTYGKIPQLVMEAMSERGSCPLSEIKYFPELQSLNLIRPLENDYSDEVIEFLNRWFDYFIIQALQPFVLDGVFQDNDFNDNDPLDCHAYQYMRSTKTMPSQSPETNPLLALDDDDD